MSLKGVLMISGCGPDASGCEAEVFGSSANTESGWQSSHSLIFKASYFNRPHLLRRCAEIMRKGKKKALHRGGNKANFSNVGNFDRWTRRKRIESQTSFVLNPSKFRKRTLRLICSKGFGAFVPLDESKSARRPVPLDRKWNMQRKGTLVPPNHAGKRPEK